MPNPSPTVEDADDEDIVQLTSPEFGSVQRVQSEKPESLILSKNINASQEASVFVGDCIQENIVEKYVAAESVEIVDERRIWKKNSNTVVNFSFKVPSPPSSPAQSSSGGISAKPPVSTNTKDEENTPDSRMFDDPDAARISEELEKALSAAIRSFQANGLRRLSPRNRTDGKSRT